MKIPKKPLIGLGLVLVLLALALPMLAQDNAPEAVAEDVETQDCAECHIDVVTDWQDSAHAQAFHSEDFQAAWSEINEDTSCLECHTTGYEAFSGEYTHEGVTCEACHGQTPADHPEQSVAIEPGLEVCATCHTTTYNEWEMSAHGEQQLACTSCHNPHPQQVRFGSSTDLCMNCHEEIATVGYAHATHVEQECTSCHWHNNMEGPGDHVLTGNLMPSGHEADVETAACVTCHEEQDEEYLANSEGISAEAQLTALVQVEELEAEIETVLAQGQNASAVRLMQGLIVGIVAGGILGVVFTRLRPGQIREK